MRACVRACACVWVGGVSPAEGGHAEPPSAGDPPPQGAALPPSAGDTVCVRACGWAGYSLPQAVRPKPLREECLCTHALLRITVHPPPLHPMHYYHGLFMAPSFKIQRGHPNPKTQDSRCVCVWGAIAPSLIHPRPTFLAPLRTLAFRLSTMRRIAPVRCTWI